MSQILPQATISDAPQDARLLFEGVEGSVRGQIHSALSPTALLRSKACGV